MAGFAVEDLLLKVIARQMPVGQILIVFGLAGALVFALLCRRRRLPVWHPAILTRPLILRAAFEVAGRLFHTLALALTSLAATSAILQATPLVVVAGAALIFGERVGWRRWTAILVGFAGVLIILRPGVEGFTPLSLLAVAGMIGFAGRDLATRAAPAVLGNLQLGVYGFAAMVPTGAMMLGWTGGAVMPDLVGAVTLAVVTAVGVAAYLALTIAMRTGEVSVVTPLRYSRLVFALILAVILLGERPDAATLAGSAIVVCSGLYTLIRTQRANRLPASH
ncbi:MAG: DMT family transporter [Paracoccaceae bacterium]|nr:MAG: DMT family transporter [Paracoccaceae bacterium]